MRWSQKNMRDRYEQLEYYSDAEYESRWARARRVMQANDCDLLLIVDAARESHDSWVTGRKYVDTIILPKEDVITAVLHREFSEQVFSDNAPTADYTRYVKQRPPVPRKGLRYINDPGPKGLAEIIAGYTPKTIGLVNSRLLTHALKEALLAELPAAEIKDVKQAFDTERAIKSPEEWDTMRLAARALEQLTDAMPYYLRPGTTMPALNKTLKAKMYDLGAHGDLHINVIFCGPQDTPSMPPGPGATPPGPLQEGDRLFTILEANSYGGHQLAMGRQYVLGEASDSFREAVRYAGEMNLYAAGMMKPGHTLGDIKRACEEKAIADGTHLRRMCWMHGLSTNGYFEQFALNDYGMEWPLVAGAVSHCHPVAFRKFPELPGDVEEETMLLNTYTITPDGGKSIIDLARYPFDVIEIPC